MIPITDPDIIAQLEADMPQGDFVTDPDIIAQLEGKEPPRHRGILKESAAAFGRGIAAVPEMFGQAAKEVDQPGGIDIVRGIGEGLVSIGEAAQKLPILQPSEGEKGYIEKAIIGTLESAPSSIAAGIPGAIIGSLGGPVGLVGGFATSGATIMGLAEKGRAKEELRAARPDLPEEEINRLAWKSALYEAIPEFASDIIAGATLGLGKTVSQPVKNTIKEMLKMPLKETAKRTALVMPAEVGTEAVTSAGQAGVRQEAGVPTLSPAQAAIESIGPSIGMTLLFGAGAHGYNAYQQRQVKNALMNPEADVETRTQAADFITENLKKKDTELAVLWDAHAKEAIGKKVSIPIDEELDKIREQPKKEAKIETPIINILSEIPTEKATSLESEAEKFARAKGLEPMVPSIADMGIKNFGYGEAYKGPEAKPQPKEAPLLGYGGEIVKEIVKEPSLGVLERATNILSEISTEKAASLESEAEKFARAKGLEPMVPSIADMGIKNFGYGEAYKGPEAKPQPKEAPLLGYGGEIVKERRYDKEDIARLPGSIAQWEAVKQAEPIEEGGRGEIGGGREVQAHEGDIVRPAEVDWNKTPMDTQSEWIDMMSTLEKAEEQSKPRLKELQGELKTLKGKTTRGQKNAIQSEIDNIKKNLNILQGQIEGRFLSELEALRNEAIKKAEKKGITDENTLNEFADQFLMEVSSERPYVEYNYNKTRSQVFDELFDHYMNKEAPKAAEKPSKSLPQKLAEAVDGKEKAKEHLDVVEKFAKTEEAQVKSIIDDTVKNPLVVAEMLANKGKSDRAASELNKAIENGNKLKLADGEITESHVDSILAAVPKIQEKIANKGVVPNAEEARKEGRQEGREVAPVIPKAEEPSETAAPTIYPPKAEEVGKMVQRPPVKEPATPVEFKDLTPIGVKKAPLLEGDKLTTKGTPYSSKKNALNSKKIQKLDGYEPVQVEGGWVLRKQEAEAEVKAGEPAKLTEAKTAEGIKYPKASKNVIFTEDAYQKAKAILKSKLNQINMGIDPELMQAGFTIAGYHLEKGARTFSAYSKAMIEDFGDKIRPYLKSFYNGVRDLPGVEAIAKGMDSYEDVAKADINVILKEGKKSLVDTFYDAISSGNMPKDNNALRKMVSDYDGKTADNARLKEAQEDLEAVIAKRARDIVQENKGTRKVFDALVDLYNNQPNLNVRTSTSIENQAYSTPVPLSYIAAELAGVKKDTKTYEPTAGNGSLLITTNPANVIANEWDGRRYENLRAQGFNAVQGNALDAILSGVVEEKSQDAVLTNPPFGMIKYANGEATKVAVDGYKMGKIDHLISADALKALQDDGKATLILGADKVPGGISTDDRVFFNWLYGNYNVTSHFEVDGKLYGRQGANWPVRVITLSGRKKSSNVSPAPGTIVRVNTWEEVYEQFQKGMVSQKPDERGGKGGAVSGGEQRPADVEKPVGITVGAKDQEADTGYPRGREGVKEYAGLEPESQGVPVSDSEQRWDAESLEADRLGKRKKAERIGAEARAIEPPGIDRTDHVKDTEFQTAYKTRSGNKDEGVLVPVNMAAPLQEALDKLEDEVGDIDEFLVNELGYDSKDALYDAFMGLQIDSVASAIHQIKKGKGLIIADQTGIGKGRQAAAVIRWAHRQGHIPVFVTAKPSLFTDMYVEDMAGIDTYDINPFIMNIDESIKGKDGEKLFANNKSAHRGTLEDIVRTGALPDGSQALFMTYSQINTDNLQRRVVRSLADKAVFILDESHNAGGDSNTGSFIRSVLENAEGVTYLSATYAKRPDNMPVYFRTDIGEAIRNDADLIDAMAVGGLPLQVVIANNLVKAGQMFRRERSYEGITIETKVDTANRGKHAKMSDAATEGLRAIVEADKAFHEVFVGGLEDELAGQGGGVLDIAGNQARESVEHTEFSSIVHNLVRQFLLGIKADTAADDAIAAIKREEKPLIAVDNTMGSFLESYVSDNGLQQGDSLGRFDYRTVLSRALERTRYIVKVLPNGDKKKIFIPLEDLDHETREIYREAQAVIDKIEADIPVSPIDWIRYRIEKAGYKIAEITGRGHAIDYKGENPVLSAVPSEEQNDKVATTRKFNSGEVDALILNVSGSTGISLHASEKFENQQQRHMIVAQAAQDINIFMQMLGRIHRTGQVVKPKYSLLTLDLPSEKRPAAITAKKMKSLNANTSSNTKSATSVKAVDLLNKYGDQIVAQHLVENDKLRTALAIGAAVEENGRPKEDIARKATGRMALMPVEVQEQFYAEVEEQYASLIDYLNKTNQNDLEPKTFDYDAQETTTSILSKGNNPATPFGADSIYGEYSIKAQGKPMTPEEIKKEMDEHLGGKTEEEHMDGLIDWLRSAEEPISTEGKDADQIRVETSKMKTAQNKAVDFIDEHRIGSTWRVEINGEVYNAIVTNIKSIHKTTGSPFSLSKIHVSLALNGSLRHITVPATQFHNIEVSGLGGSIDSLFKEKPKDERDTAKIVTGNLLAAYGEIQEARGTIINFTKADGSVEQGILLPKTFDLKENTHGDYRFKTAQDAQKYLEESNHPDLNRFGIASRDSNVRIRPYDDGIIIQVPKAKAKGGKYFLDKDLLAVTGDFVSQGQTMQVAVPMKAKAEKALEILLKKTSLYALPSMAEDARTILNDPLQATQKAEAEEKDTQPVEMSGKKEGLTLEAINKKVREKGTTSLTKEELEHLMSQDIFKRGKAFTESDAEIREIKEALSEPAEIESPFVPLEEADKEIALYSIGEGGVKYELPYTVIGSDTEAIKRLAFYEGDGRLSDGTLLEEVSVSMQSDVARTLEGIARAFGKKIIYFKTNLRLDGAIIAEYPNNIYLNVHARNPHLVTIGHELLHSMKAEYPKLYGRLLTDMEGLMKNLPAYREALSRSREAAGQTKPVSSPLMREELLADFMGEQFLKRDFWDAMQKKSPTIFEKVVQTVKALLDKVISLMKGKDIIGTAFFKDIQKARNLAADVMNEYAIKGKAETPALSRVKGKGSSLRKAEVSEGEQKRYKEALPKRPLDRIMRLPFRAIGGVDERTGEWRIGRKAYDKTIDLLTKKQTGYTGVDNLLETIRKGLVDKHNLPANYIKYKSRHRIDRNTIMEEGMDFARAIAEMPDEARKIINDILQDKGVSPAEFAALSEPVREKVVIHGKELVDLGFLGKETYEKHLGEYLHRSYQKYMEQTSPFGWLARKIRVIGSEFKQRGFTLQIQQDHIPDWNEGDTVYRMASLGKAVRFIHQNTVKEFKDKGWTVTNEFTIQGFTKDGKTVLHRDWTKEERERMGEIQDSAFNVAETYRLISNDIATGRLFDKISKDKELASDTSVEGWVMIPRDPIPGTRVLKFGNLAGKWLHPEVYRDITVMHKYSEPSIWKSLLTEWKLNKTVRNPVVHMNNLVSNFHLMDMADVSLTTFVDGVKDIKAENDFYKQAKEDGIFGEGFFGAEIKEMLNPGLEMTAKGNNPLMFAWNIIKKGDTFLKEFYQKEDDLFRMAIYKDRINRGFSREDAAIEAKEWLIDYDISAEWIQKARQTVIPFISYPYRALGLISKTAITKPWKVAKYYAIYAGLNAVAASMTGGDDDEKKERAVMPEYAQGKMWFGAQRMIKMPFYDSFGQPIYFDISRKLPGGDIFDLTEKGAVPFFAPLSLGGPVDIMFSLYKNKDSFTGKEITKATDTSEEVAAKVSDYLFKQYAPNNPLVPLSYSQKKILDAWYGIPDIIGRQYSVPSATLATLGLKTTPIDVEKMRAMEIQKRRGRIRNIRFEIGILKRDRQRGRIDEGAFQKGLEYKRDKLKKEMKALWEFSRKTQ